MSNIKTSMRMLIAVVNSQQLINNSNVPLDGEWINMLVYTYDEYYWAINRNEVLVK